MDIRKFFAKADGKKNGANAAATAAKSKTTTTERQPETPSTVASDEEVEQQENHVFHESLLSNAKKKEPERAKPKTVSKSSTATATNAAQPKTTIAKRKQEPTKYNVGTKVEKFFPGDGTDRGKVISIRNDNDEVLYKVEYSNGNRQEYNETELEAKLCTSKQDTDEPLDDAKVAATMSPRVTKKPRVDYEKESNRNNDNKEEESDDDDEVVPSSRPRKTSMARRKILDDDSSDDENVDMQVDDASPQKQEPPPTKKVTAKTSSTAPPAANAWGSLMMDRGQSAKKPKKQSSDRKPAALKDETSMEVDETSSAKKQSKRKSVALKDDTKVDETSAENEQPSPAKKPKTNGWGSLVVDRGQSATKKPKKGSTKDMTSSTASGAKRIVKPAYCKGDDLPVITEPAKMFDDMVFSSLTENGTNAAVLLPLLKKVQSSPIRVATMCSGTESPVLALDMLSKSIQDFYHAHQEVFEGVKVKDGEQLVQIEHVFSAEIEPWKQSYIERNFHPPLLFRDIRELGNEQAYTAYGALVDVPSQPGCVDLLVAGTSCVDYSNLNNEKKTIKDGGESGQTWRGMIEWIKKAAPPMVILENVIGAPWKEKIKVMEGLGYYAAWVKVDTKDYYIPHTRQRGYLFAVKKDSSLAGASPVSAKATKEWADTVLTTLKRPASGALDAFMLPNDDPRVLLGRVRMATSESADNKSTDWSKCETRHLFARASEELGEKRPLTGSDSGSTTLPPFAWNEWASAQVQRIHDLMDILTLRCAKEGVDCTHKTMVWNLSQNVDRDTIGRLGLSQCLTPSGVPYVSNRGGPLVGEELLLLQGIPAEDLLLTKETEKNLKDLAGNAMSTTVVGACMLGALLYGHPAIGTREAEANISSDMMGPSLVPRPLALATGVVKITRDMANYEKAPLLLGALEDMTVDSFHKLLREAVSSARMCMSEGPDEALPLSSLLRCKLCGFTCSKECASPFPSKYEEHDLVSLADSTDTRVSPAAFRTKCLSALPMRVKLHSFDFASIQKPREVSDEVWNGWKNAAMATTASSASSSSSEEYRFTQLKRSHMWTAVFISSNGSRLELQLSSQCAVWLLFASTPSKKGLVGEALERPIARMRVQPVDGNVLMNGNWEVCLPTSSQIELTIEGVGAKLPSWRSRLGLKGPYESELRFEKLKISVETNDCAELKDAIDGQYESLLKCGAPCGSLHKRCGDESEAASSDMYFFLESGRYTVGDDDTFVFSPEKHRTSYNEYKNVVAKVCKEANYRPEIESECNDQPRTIRAITQGSWVVLKGALLRPASSAREMQSTVMVPMESPRVALSANGWKAAPSIIEAQVSLGSSCDWLFAECSKLLSTSTTAPNVEVNIQKSASIFRRLAFATSRLDVPLVVQDWLPLDSSAIERKDGDEIACEVCAPAKPALKWHMIRKGKSLLAVPIEDGKMQARFEYAMKHRPHPWLVTLEIPEQDTQPTSEAMLHVKVGINAVSLIHRALGLFPLTEARRALIDARHDQCGTIFEWRVVPHVDKPLASFPKLSFTSNKGNEPAKQPPGFQGRCLLRPEQLRSLAWMLSQEASSSPFYEEEVVEAILPNLNWRAEARAKRPVLVRGGIVADEVGYGKTAITLGLIDAAQTVNGDPPEVPAEFKGSLFYTKATLVIVPTHLMGQWPKEVKKFLGSNKKVIEIKDIGSMNKLTVSDIMHADLVIANFNLLSNDKYFSRLARFSGVGILDRCPKRRVDVTLMPFTRSVLLAFLGGSLCIEMIAPHFLTKSSRTHADTRAELLKKSTCAWTARRQSTRVCQRNKQRQAVPQ